MQYPAKDTEEYKSILEHTIDMFGAWSVIGYQNNLIEDFRKYLKEERHLQERRKVVINLLDIDRIKKLSDDKFIEILKRASDYYSQEMLGRYLYTARNMDENVKDRSPFSDIVFYVLDRIETHHLNNNCHCSPNSPHHKPLRI
jgi:hypothetical protein